MEKLDIKSKQVLKQHCLKLIQEDKVFYDIPSLYEKGTRNIKVTPKGEIKIGPSVLRSQGADAPPGSEFYLSVDNDIITLTLVKKGSWIGAEHEDPDDNTDSPTDDPSDSTDLSE